MIKFIIGIPAIIAMLVFFQSCIYEKEQLPPVSACIDTINVSYSAKIRPLLQANCFTCHANGSTFGNVSLENYDGVKQAAASGSLLGAISHSPGFSPMPQGALKLSDCNINLVRIWIAEGLKEN